MRKTGKFAIAYSFPPRGASRLSRTGARRHAYLIPESAGETFLGISGTRKKNLSATLVQAPGGKEFLVVGFQEPQGTAGARAPMVRSTADPHLVERY